MRPPDFLYTFVTAIFIIGPSCYMLAYTNIQLFGLIGGIFVDIFYLASMLNLLRLIYKCAVTEPGIIPAVSEARNKELHDKKPQSGEIKVVYKTESERDFNGDKFAYFFSNDRFKYVQSDVDPVAETYALSLCMTCNIVRPPRAFHCKDCGVCIEA